MPINGAEVILVANGNIYSQTTDSNGVTKFITAFPADEIDGDISVSFSGFKAEHQRVTLQADRIQDIRLDKTSGTLTVGFTGQARKQAEIPTENPTKYSKGNNATINPGPTEGIVDDCTSKSLSPEECINAGKHSYTASDKLTDSDGTTTCEVFDTEITDMNFVFDGKGNLTSEFGNVTELKRENKNSYSGSSPQPDSLELFVGTLTFNENGFEEELSAFNAKDNRLNCKWLRTYTILK